MKQNQLANKRPHSNKKNEPELVGDAIKKMLKAYHIEDKFAEANLVASWEQIMGGAIAKRTSKIYIQNKKLFVHLTSAPLKHELNMSRDKILLLLTKELGGPVVNEVIIK